MEQYNPDSKEVQYDEKAYQGQSTVTPSAGQEDQEERHGEGHDFLAQ